MLELPCRALSGVVGRPAASCLPGLASSLVVSLVVSLVACKAPVTEGRSDRVVAPRWLQVPGELSVPSGADTRPSDGTGFGGQQADPPQASENYVFVANPDGRSVVVIDSQELTIRSIETGNSPTYLRTLPGADAALVLNVGSGDASFVRVSEGGRLVQQRMDVVKGANAVEVAPDGAHAVVFFDADTDIAGDDFGDFQSVSVVHIDGNTAVEATMAVGFKPERVVFQEDGTRAFVITEQGISVLDFGVIDEEGAGIAPELRFGSQQVDRDGILVTPDGAYAIGQLPGSAELRLLDLASGDETVRQFWGLFPPVEERADDWDDFRLEHPVDEPLPKNVPGWLRRPALVGLRYDAQSQQLLAVEIDSRSVLRVPVPGGLTGAADVALQALAHDVRQADFFPGTNQVLAYRAGAGVSRVSVIDFDLVVPLGEPLADAGVGESAVESYELRKGVQRAFISPDGTTAIIQHDRVDGDPNEDGIPLEIRVLRSAGHTLLHPATGEMKLERTAGDLDRVVFSREGGYAFLLYDERALRYPVGEQTAVREIHRVELSRFLTNPIILLDSAPIFGAVVPGQTRVFVSQDHLDGRLTFVDWRTGEVQTVTGFELNSRIQN